MLFQPRQPFSSMFERHAELTERERFHCEDWVTFKRSRFEPIGLSHLGAMLEKYHKLQPIPNSTAKLKVAFLSTEKQPEMKDVKMKTVKLV